MSTAEAYGQRFKPLGWYPFIYNVQCFNMPADQKVLSVVDKTNIIQ